LIFGSPHSRAHSKTLHPGSSVVVVVEVTDANECVDVAVTLESVCVAVATVAVAVVLVFVTAAVGSAVVVDDSGILQFVP
jgi:hypothetical protein